MNYSTAGVSAVFVTSAMVGGIVLNVLVGKNSGQHGDSKTIRWLSGTAYTFSFNGIFMMVTSLLSSDSAAYLPVFFYCVLFQATGALSYIISSLTRQYHEVSLAVVVGLCSGGMHAFHFAYSYNKNYIEDDDKKWWNKKIEIPKLIVYMLR
ncbi:hypothetical protein MRX96_049978 [Rhipicephalus microplus]